MANNTWPFPWPEDQIAHYTVYRVNDPPVINGRLDEPGWQAAPKIVAIPRSGQWGRGDS